jgi:hypothetical protein
VPWVLISLLLAVDPTTPATPVQNPMGTTFPTAKSVEAVQACLTEKLSEVGEVAAVQPDRGTTILLIRGNPDGPMVIELTPQMVTVTTKLLTGARAMIKGCI